MAYCFLGEILEKCSQEKSTEQQNTSPRAEFCDKLFNTPRWSENKIFRNKEQQFLVFQSVWFSIWLLFYLLKNRQMFPQESYPTGLASVKHWV